MKIYWEKQGFDRLCGVHAVNSLLQGPFYDASSMAQTALELDRRQQDFLGSSLAQSSNVSIDGNYSIQVLIQCLNKMQLSVESVDSEINKNPGKLMDMEGFVCNSHQHWFSIRKIRGVWYNLNSTNAKTPQIISEFYFGAFLCSVREKGYHVFVVKGKFPVTSQSSMPALNKNQHWMKEEQIKLICQKRIKQKSYVINIGAEDQASIQQAIKRSMQSEKKEQFELQEEKLQKDEDKVKAFAGKAQTMSVGKVTNYSGYIKINPSQEPQAYFAYKQHLKSKFLTHPPPPCISLRFIIFSVTATMQFSVSDSVESLYDFVNSQVEEKDLKACGQFVLVLRHPTRNLMIMQERLCQLGLEEGDKIYVQQIKD